ncbi:MAG: cytochrome c [Myxococcales bacterium]|nr:cytochrome c [Myxococcales bacterium]MDH3483993.1 cytochrome c [Myxococcales bacterium]
MKRVRLALVFCFAASGAQADSLVEHDYLLNCAGCHQLNGSGSVTVPSLHGISGLSDTSGTRVYLIRVPGVAQAPLSDERLAALMNWLLERFTGRAPIPRYTAKEVSQLRKNPLLDPRAERARLSPAPISDSSER